MPSDPILIQVRGASGSGKSTLVRGFLASLTGSTFRYEDKDRWGMGHVESAASRPFALGYAQPNGSLLVVPGHYDAPGGGCDMIKKADHVYDIANAARQHGANVLMEGLFLSKEYARLLAHRHLWPRPPVVIHLDLPEAECEESVQLRRGSNGRVRRPLSKHASDYREVRSAVACLRASGVDVETHDRASAMNRLMELLL